MREGCEQVQFFKRNKTGSSLPPGPAMEEKPTIEELNIQTNKVSPSHDGSRSVPKESLAARHCSGSGITDGLSEDLLSVDQVSQMMREQDADLLERMHVDASLVSQYSSGRTPDLRPREVSGQDLLEFSPLTPSRTSQVRETSLHGVGNDQPDPEETSSRELAKASSLGEAVMGECATVPPFPFIENHRQNNKRASLGIVREESVSCSWDGELELPEECGVLVLARYRRLLSGEIRTLNGADNDEELTEQIEASTIAAGQDETAAAIEKQQKKETGLAEARRFREAMQFAEAVGERMAMNRDEIRIIEDHSDHGETDDDDDDACEPKEVVLCDQDIIVDESSSSQAMLEMMNAHANQQDAQEGSIGAPLSIPVDAPQRMTKRPVWPFGAAGAEHGRFLDTLYDDGNVPNFVYKGICANPPEITKAGIQRGNYAQLHRKAWLEVSDKYHRYGKNLRLYYRFWERLGFPTNRFFDWLDSKGDAAGQPLPNLDECPRSILDSDTVLYISNPVVTEGYALDIICGEDGRARIIDVDSRPVTTGIEGWIFVLRDGVMYGAEKITSISGQSKQRFHHSSFFGGKAVAAAGIIITDEEGYLTRLYPHSGHYRPGEAHMQRMLFFLHRKGVDLRTFEMDTQQFRHVSREKDANKSKDGDKEKDKGNKEAKEGEKKFKKIDSLHLEKAVTVACFLAHKASFIGQGIFDSIHKIRKADATSVSEALQLVDHGGHWRRPKHAMTVGGTENQNSPTGDT